MRRKQVRQLTLARWALRALALASLIVFLHVYTLVADASEQPAFQCGVPALVGIPDGPTLNATICVLDTRKLALCLVDDINEIPGIARCFVVVKTLDSGVQVVEPAEIRTIMQPRGT